MKLNKTTPKSSKPAPTPAKNAPVSVPVAVTVAKTPPIAPKPAAPPQTSVALKLRSPAAKAVYVAGSFNAWQIGPTPLHPEKAGEWRVELQLTPGRYEYLFVVDGSWVSDPTAGEAAPNPFGGSNSVLSVA